MRLAKVCRCILSLDLDNHSVHVMTFTMTVSKLFEKSLELVMEFCSSVIRRVALLSLPSSGNVFSIWANEPKIHNHARNRNRFELITSARSMRRFNHETKKNEKVKFFISQPSDAFCRFLDVISVSRFSNGIIS